LSSTTAAPEVDPWGWPFEHCADFNGDWQRLQNHQASGYFAVLLGMQRLVDHEPTDTSQDVGRKGLEIGASVD
jgi:hypothetical protein